MNSACDLPFGSECRTPEAGARRLIVAGAERRAGPGEDDGADIAIRIGLVERLKNLRLKAARQRIHAIRTIECNGRDLLVDAIKQLLIAHP